VINPDDVIRQYGADTLRLYEMFMGPFDAVKPWSTKGIEGSFRFLQKVWRLLEEGTVTDEADSPAISKQLHKTIKKVGEDIEGMHFNTAISQMMILANDAMKEKRLSKLFLETFALILSPFAPHMAEELWEKLGHKETLAYAPWPAFDPALVVDDAFELVFAVNGKKRSSKQVPMGIVEADAISEAMADVAIQKNLEGKEVVKKIYVPGKLVNIVVR
jgi:leucyl-tRNA synthetase